MVTLDMEPKRERLNFYVPIEGMSPIHKSVEGNEHGNYIRGWASTPAKDLQSDIVDSHGLDISELLDSGYVNYEHDTTKIVGVPTRNSYVDLDKGLFVETKLDMNSPYAQEMWSKACMIAEQGVNRRLGYSIEGYGLRSKLNPSVFERVIVTGVAITENPANPEATWETLVKSMTTGYGVDPADRTSAGALRHQHSARDIHKLAFSLKDLTIADFKTIAKTLDDEGRFSEDVAVLILQLGYGLSRDTAMRQVTKFMNTKESTVKEAN